MQKIKAVEEFDDEAYFQERANRAKRELRPGDVVKLCISKIGVKPFGRNVSVERSPKLGTIYWNQGNVPGGFAQLEAETNEWEEGTVATIISTVGVYSRKNFGSKIDRRNKPTRQLVILVDGKLSEVMPENVGRVISKRKP